MSSDQLFLLEILVLKFNFPLDPQLVGNSYLQMSFEDIFLFELPLNLSDLSPGTTDSVFCSFGKSLLFPCPSKYLKQCLKDKMLNILLFVAQKEKGSISFQWKSEFSDMVKFSETVGVVKSVATETSQKLKNKGDEVIAQIDMFIRLSCLGTNVQTPFKVIDKDKRKEYIIKTRRGSRTFKCEFTTEKSCEIIPVSPLYEMVGKKAGDSNTQEVSLKPLFDSPVSPKPSPYQAVDDFKEFVLHNDQSENDMISICFRPSENKFFDFLNMISAEVSTHDKGTYVTITRDRPALNEFGNIENQPFEGKGILEKINRNVCNSSYCPASVKLKTYGLGPLSVTSGLGTLDKPIDVPISYGLSHLYGSLEKYGPYALFSKSKNVSETFNRVATHSDSMFTSDILRLKGGGEENVAPKSPLLECRSIIEQVDMILTEYKNSLGPCGKSTCPRAYNIAINTCVTTCGEEKSSKNNSCCEIDDCVYKPTLFQNTSGCESPQCAYRKYKLGLVDDDANLELSLLPPAISGNCGYPGCQNTFETELPPIHWDCPEPLPKDSCKNPFCPFLPKELRDLSPKKVIEPCKRNLHCPYSLALNCDHPLCPFNFQTCPFKGSNSVVSQSTDKGSTCWSEQNYGNKKNVPDLTECNDQSEAKRGDGDNEVCGNSDCPYANPIFPVNTHPNMQDNVIDGTGEKEVLNTQNDIALKRARKKKKRGRFVYSVGDKYPGVNIGHKECVIPVLNVPHKMGWLWNIHTPILNLKERRGWRPGAISKLLAKRIKTHRQNKNLALFKEPCFGKGGASDETYSSNVVPKPTLQLQKNQGSYWITMNPLKDPKKLAEYENPYMECSPMTLKISANKDSKDEDQLCFCDEGNAESSDSELDIEFTPPAGIVQPELFKRKKNVIHCDSQYNPDDFQSKKPGTAKGGKAKDKKNKNKKGKK